MTVAKWAALHRRGIPSCFHWFARLSVKGWWPAIHALKDKIQVNDLCWTRTRNGKYWLGRITGEWEYRNPPEFKRADLVNLRAAELFEVDVVGIYLQLVEGGILFPSTCKADTEYFEFVLKRKNKAFDGDVFVFQTRNLFEGKPSQNVHPLDTAEMKRFCLQQLDLMPANIQRWVEVWKTLTEKKVVKKATTVA